MDGPQRFFAKRVSVNGQAIIKLGGECDVATLDELNRVLREVASEHPDELVIDLSEATFVDSQRAVQITGLDSFLGAGGDSSPSPK